MIRRRRVSIVFLLVLLLVLSTLTPAFAQFIGETGADGGGPSGGGGNLPTGRPATRNAYGYRLYLVNGGIVDLTSNKWGNNGDVTSYLFNTSSRMSTRSLAIHELYATKTPNYLDQKKVYNWLGYGSMSDLIKATPSSGTFSHTSFAPLFKGTSLEGKFTLHQWRFDMSNAQAETSKWANAVFRDGFKNVDDITKFLQNYRQVLKNNGVSQSLINTIPEDASEFIKGDWGIVLEPVLVMSLAQQDAAPAWTVSYQDLNDFFKTVAPGQSIGSSLRESRVDALGGLYNDFTTKDGVHISTQGNSKTKGFALFLSSEMGITLEKESKHAAGYNVVLQADEVKSKKYSADVSSGAVLTTFADLDENTNSRIGKYNNNTFKSFSSIGGVSENDIRDTALTMVGRKWTSSLFKDIGITGAKFNTRSKFNSVLDKSLLALNDTKAYTLATLSGMSKTNYDKLASGKVNSVSIYQIDLKNSDVETSLDYIHKAFESLNLSNVQTNSVITDVKTGNADTRFGSVYDSTFTVKNSDITKTIQSALSRQGITASISEVSTLTKGYSNATNAQSMLTDIQTGALLSSNIAVKYNPDNPMELKIDGGRLYLTVSHVFKDTTSTTHINSIALKGKESSINNGVVAYESAGRGNSSGSVSYKVQEGATLKVDKSVNSAVSKLSGEADSGTFALVWSKADSNAVDLSNNSKVDQIARDIAGKLNQVIMPNSSGGALVKNAFKSATGINADVVYLGRGTAINKTFGVGSKGDAQGNLKGYNVLVVTVEKPDIPAVSEGTLRPHELNYIYGDFRGDKSTSSTLFEAKGISGKFDIVNHKTFGQGDGLVKNYGTEPLYYNASVGKFEVASKNPKSFNSETVVPSHAFNLRRSMFGDKVVLSSFRNGGNLEYIESILGIKSGYVGKPTSLSGKSGTTTTSAKKSDNFRWFARNSSGKMILDAFGRTNYWKDNSAWYKLTTSAMRYTPSDKGVSSLPESEVGKKLEPNTAEKGEIDFAVGGLNQSKGVLKFYPEVGMSAYLPELKGKETITNTSRATVYVMGEKERSLSPLALRMISLKGDPTKDIVGTLASDTFATDSQASKLSESMNELPVVYAGGNINIKANVKSKLDFVSYAMDLDSSVKNKFADSNKDYNTLAEHNAFVNANEKNLGVDLKLKVTDNGNQVEQYSDFNVKLAESKMLGESTVKEFKVSFKDGKLTDLGDYNSLVDAITKDYGVSKDKVKSMLKPFEDQVVRALESRKDSANKSSEEVIGGVRHGKWYDEETTTFIVRRHATTYEIGDIVLSDKIDIESGPAGATSKDELFSKGYKGEWYLSMFFKSKLEGVSGTDTVFDPSKPNTFDPAVSKGTVLINEVKIQPDGGFLDFIIPDATTSDMRSW